MADLNCGTKECPNCNKPINLASFLMHEAFCTKNIIKCERCREPIQKDQIKEHNEEFHAKIKCVCGVLVEKMLMDAHKKETCEKRQAECCYCRLELDFKKMKDHLIECGAQTELCDRCNKYIKKQDQTRHTTSNCSYPLSQKQSPPKSRIPNSFTDISYRARNSAIHHIDTKRKATSSSDDENLVPCEFCGEKLSYDNVYQHQVYCEFNEQASMRDFALDGSNSNTRHTNGDDRVWSRPRHVDNVETRDFETDELLREYMMFDRGEDEESDDDSITTTPAAAAAAKKEESVMIPCERCGKEIDFNLYNEHYFECDGDVNSLSKRLAANRLSRNQAHKDKPSSSFFTESETRASETKRASFKSSLTKPKLDYEKYVSEHLSSSKPKSNNFPTTSTQLSPIGTSSSGSSTAMPGTSLRPRGIPTTIPIQRPSVPSTTTTTTTTSSTSGVRNRSTSKPKTEKKMNYKEF